MRFDKLYCNGNNNPLGTSCDILLSWNYQYDGKRNEKQIAFSIRVSSDGDIFETGWIQGDIMQFCLSDAFMVQPGKAYQWTVTVRTDSEILASPEQTFETAVTDFSGAAWITTGDVAVESPIFHRDFHIAGSVKKARAYVTGLGFFVCSCNGIPCTDHLFMPPNTQYDTFCYMETLDITAFLRMGENHVDIQLGNGYDMTFSQFGYRYTGKKGLRCILQITYADGETEQIFSDERWRWRDSPILKNSIYHGEVYDARLQDFSYLPAAAEPGKAPLGKILANEMPPIRVIHEYLPVNDWECEDGTVYDFGFNLQGISDIRLEAPCGTQIILRHSEMIFPDGTLDSETNRGAAAEDVYICNGTGEEHYRPAFTYHGFRYVLVSGLRDVTYFSIKALQISADVEHESSFSCSDAMINRIHKLCNHSMRCNLVSIPTDCPVRDERTPCQMDSQMVEAAVIYNYNMYSYYKKWLLDIINTPCGNGEENPDWHGDYITLSYRIYRLLGDIRPIRELYPRIREDIKIWLENSDNGIYAKGFGDWCLPNDNTWAGIGECKTAVNTSLLYSYCCIMEEMARLLGYTDDWKWAKDWKDTISRSFSEHCIQEDGTVLSGRQPDMIMPLYFGMLKGETKERAMKRLIEKTAEDGHLDTGGFGTMALIPALAYSGGIDLIPHILNEGTYPGFGFWLSTGATSLWEQWAVKGVMHSHSHMMNSGIDSAFYRIFCGITTVTPGFKHFRIAPRIPADMQFCKCSVQTVSGKISIRLERLYGGLELSMEIPPNTRADVVLPEWERYADCTLWDGERQIEKKKNWNLSGGRYQFRLVPRRNLNG